jgi:hypothetical protein
MKQPSQDKIIYQQGQQPAKPEEVIDYFRNRLHEDGDVMPGWPENVRSLGSGGVMFLGIDKQNRLYWDGKPIEIQRRLKFSRLQIAGAVIVGLATLIGGVGTGINEGFDFGCKVHWLTTVCKP